MNQQKIFNILLGKDLSVFVEKVFNTLEPGTKFINNWHIDALCYKLEQCFNGEIKRLVITMPPRYLKSLSASVAFPAWVLGKDSSKKIICASYSKGLAVKLSIGCKTIMESNWYRNCFPSTRLDPRKNTEIEFMTTGKGFRYATSVGGTLTGRGGNVIIIDDPHKAEEANSATQREAVLNWYRNTLLSRLDNKKEDCIIVIQQRLHENDLAGYLLETGDWEHLNLPAIAEIEQRLLLNRNTPATRAVGRILHEERESKEDLDKIKNEIGSYNYAAQYQQNPSPTGGGIVKWEWFKQFDQIPPKTQDAMIIQSWDTASKIGEHNDYSVCITCLNMNGASYILDVFRERLEYPALKAKVIGMAQHWKANTILMEDSSAGSVLIQDLRQSHPISIISVTPKGDKQTRMMAESPAIEAGRVYVPLETHWLADFQRELVLFPKGKHDDQVDSLSQYLYYVRVRDARNGLVSTFTGCGQW